MATEAQLYLAVTKGLHPHSILQNWIGTTKTEIKGTQFSLVKFSDGSRLHVKTASADAIDPEIIAEEFFHSGFALATIQWLLATPTAEWPAPIRSAYALAAGRDPFADGIWTELAAEARTQSGK